MDMLVNNIDSIKSVEVEKPTLSKKEKVESVASKKSSEDEVKISVDVKNFQEKFIEAEKYKKELEKSETSTKDEIKKFQEKVKNFQQNYSGVEEKIVYSLMTLPAFRDSKSIKVSSSPTVQKELDEIRKIEQELNRGGKMDKVLEDAIEFLMKSLLSE